MILDLAKIDRTGCNDVPKHANNAHAQQKLPLSHFSALRSPGLLPCSNRCRTGRKSFFEHDSVPKPSNWLPSNVELFSISFVFDINLFVCFFRLFDLFCFVLVGRKIMRPSISESYQKRHWHSSYYAVKTTNWELWNLANEQDTKVAVLNERSLQPLHSFFSCFYLQWPNQDW